MASYHIGETIICWRNVKNEAGAYVDPATAMKISICDPANGAEVANEDMVKDTTGKYHYDYTTTLESLIGKYRVTYTATDGARITIEKDTFEVAR